MIVGIEIRSKVSFLIDEKIQLKEPLKQKSTQIMKDTIKQHKQHQQPFI